MLSLRSKQSHGCSCQGCKATNSNHTGTLRNLPNLHQHAPELSRTLRHQPFGTFRNLPPEPTPAYTDPPKSSGTFRNLPPEPTPFYTELFGTFRNLPPEPKPAYAGTLLNLLEPASGTYTSTHRNSPEPSGTPPPEPSPAHAGTFRNLSEPSGTFLRNLLLRPAPAHTRAYLG